MGRGLVAGEGVAQQGWQRPPSTNSGYMKTSSVSLYLLTATLFAVPVFAQNETKPAEARPDRTD